MGTHRTRRMLRGSAAVISLSAALFASAGTAQATEPALFLQQRQQHAGHLWRVAGGAIFATIVDLRNPEG